MYLFGHKKVCHVRKLLLSFRSTTLKFYPFYKATVAIKLNILFQINWHFMHLCSYIYTLRFIWVLHEVSESYIIDRIDIANIENGIRQLKLNLLIHYFLYPKNICIKAENTSTKECKIFHFKWIFLETNFLVVVEK